MAEGLRKRIVWALVIALIGYFGYVCVIVDFGGSSLLGHAVDIVQSDVVRDKAKIVRVSLESRWARQDSGSSTEHAEGDRKALEAMLVERQGSDASPGAR